MAARDRDRWYGVVILSVVSSMLVIALTYWTIFAWVLEVATIPFGIYASVRFAALDQRSGRLLSPWLEQNPYTGPAAGFLNPLRTFALTHPFPIGITISAVIVGLTVLVGILLRRA
jgi:hypothetical protein